MEYSNKTRGTDKFYKPNSSYISKFSKEMVDYFGNSYLNKIICYNDKCWFLKDNPKNKEQMKRDFLAFYLGGKWFNIPEMISLSKEQCFEISRLFGYNICEESYLVRLAQDYKPCNLNIQNLDEAIAGELIFSLWIRRRDAHSSNRVFINGLPMFFDFDACFTDDDFFREGPDSGYFPNWRFWKEHYNKLNNSLHIRKLENNKPITLHPINNEEMFWKYIDYYKKLIINDSIANWMTSIHSAGYQNKKAKDILLYLASSSVELDKSIIKMKTVLEKPLFFYQ